jgi:hypothetical protein
MEISMEWHGRSCTVTTKDDYDSADSLAAACALVIVVRRCGRGGAEPRTWLSPSEVGS